jgi:hypothetical protein
MQTISQHKEEYAAKLKDPRWQKKRLKILERDEWTCQKCYDVASTLVVHHRMYLVDTEPWDYSDELLVTLCENCHEEEREEMANMEHDLIEILKGKFWARDIGEIATGFLYIQLPHTSEVTASMLRWVLSDRDILIELKDRYLQHIQEGAVEQKDLKNGKTSKTDS